MTKILILLFLAILILPLATSYEGTECNVPIIYFHDIQDNVTSYIHASKIDFKDVMEFLNQNNYTSITLEEYYSWTKGEFKLPEKPVVIVFDDAFKGVYTNAYPIMKYFGYNGVLALLTDNVGEKIRMSYNESMLLYYQGWEIASHSKSHKNLLNSSEENRMEEFSQSKYIIYNNTGIMPTTFITPFNFQNSTTGIECLREYNICTGWGHSEKWDARLAPHPVTLYDLPRLIINNNTNISAMKKVIWDYGRFNQNCNNHVNLSAIEPTQGNYLSTKSVNINDNNLTAEINQTKSEINLEDSGNYGIRMPWFSVTIFFVLAVAAFLIYRRIT